MQPENGNYLAIFLNTLNRFDPTEASRRAGAILTTPEGHEPVVITQAAEILLDSAGGLPQAEASRLFHQLMPILQAALEKLERGDEGGVDRSTSLRACALLGFYHEAQGESQLALRSYSRGLAADPSNVELLVARGILLYGESPRAIADLELAIQYGSTMIWPYYFLSHHSLLGGQFERCRTLAERALEMDGSDATKSELAEWLAIAQSERGYPAEVVRDSFDRAIRFDATNERARRNLAAFEEAVRPVPAGAYETRDRSAIRISGLSERRIRPAA